MHSLAPAPPEDEQHDFDPKASLVISASPEQSRRLSLIDERRMRSPLSPRQGHPSVLTSASSRWETGEEHGYQSPSLPASPTKGSGSPVRGTGSEKHKKVELIKREPTSNEDRLSITRVKTVVVNAQLDFTARLLHALVIAGLLFHLKLTELLLKCIYCVDGRLMADMEVACFQGDHAVTFGIAMFLLIFYSIGYPLATFGVLLRAHRKKQRKLRKKQATMKLMKMVKPKKKTSLKRQVSIKMGRTMTIQDLGVVLCHHFSSLCL
jgi:hypothetical protein